MDSYWIAFYRFGSMIGVKQNDDLLRRLGIMERIAASIGFWYPRDGICIVSDRFAGTHWDDARNRAGMPTRLHCETGPAVHFRDGWGLHYWHGTRVPAHWIEQRDKLDPKEVIKVQNVEQRAAGAAICGWPKMLSVLRSKTIDKHENPEIGELIELTLPGLDEPGRFLKAMCPRNGMIVEGIPRISDIDQKPIETAIAAQAWRIGDPASEFQIPPKRT